MNLPQKLQNEKSLAICITGLFDKTNNSLNH
jgi:hypothetical protein